MVGRASPGIPLKLNSRDWLSSSLGMKDVVIRVGLLHMTIATGPLLKIFAVKLNGTAPANLSFFDFQDSISKI